MLHRVSEQGLETGRILACYTARQHGGNGVLQFLYGVAAHSALRIQTISSTQYVRQSLDIPGLALALDISGLVGPYASILEAL